MNNSPSEKTHTIIRKLNFGFWISFIFLITGLGLSYYSLQLLLNRTEWVNHTNEVLLKLENIISVLKDAETGQRGFLLTENPDFLEPYIRSYHKAFQNYNEVRALTIDNSKQQQRLDTLKTLIVKRFRNINQTIELQKSGNKEAAYDIVSKGIGKKIMDDIRGVINRMIRKEMDLRNERIAAVKTSSLITPVLIFIVSILALFITVVIYYILKKDVKKRLKAEAELSEAHNKLEYSYEELRIQEELLRGFNLALEEKVELRTKELKKRNFEVQKINEDLDNIVYAASHDLKAPDCKS